MEMARGCPFACRYCELGNTVAYRPQDTDYLLWQVDQCNRTMSRKVTLFAPDEASHPGYGDVLDRIYARRLEAGFGSMRFEQLMKADLPLRRNTLIRVGLDGLTEKTRARVGRKQTDKMVVDFFRWAAQRGYSQLKIFMICCYPWDTLDDFWQWTVLMKRIAAIPVGKNVNVRIKFTPFIPQPATPLGNEPPTYSDELVQAISEWFGGCGKRRCVRHPPSEPGWFFVSDGIMSRTTHALQCALTLGDECILTGDSHSIGGIRGTGAGRREWEVEYYGAELRRLTTSIAHALRSSDQHG
jgi:radical SAM superfamily enzyme YgiQ (UPF0313 family)